MLVKICGIRNIKSAKIAAEAGADFLGFNFVPTSKRLVTPSRAKKIIAALPKKDRPTTVGIFMDQPAMDIGAILSQAPLDMLQFHGKENPKFCGSFGLPYIKAFGLERDTSTNKLSKRMSEYRAKYFMLDRPDRKKGPVINLKKVSWLAKKFPILLAGGLTPDNVRSMVIKAGKIKGVDVAGGVEIKGKKSAKKIKDFIHNARLDS